ncbi:MAG: hypothetical protein ACW967_08205 [Candidatus Hodarchaeales archaeon]
MNKVNESIHNDECIRNWDTNQSKSNHDQNSKLDFHTLDRMKELQLQEYIKSAKAVFILENQLPSEF